MCNPLVIAGGMMMASSVMGGMAASNQAHAAAEASRQNARIAEQAAKDAELRGDFQAGIIRMKTGRLISRQRTAYAVSGVDVSVGTPADFQEATRFLGETDVVVARSDAAREAYGYRASARNLMMQASASEASGNAALAGSILGGLGQMIAIGGMKGGKAPTPSPSVSV